MGTAELLSISEPWDTWKPREVTAGRWQAVRDHQEDGGVSRRYDWEEVQDYDGRERRSVYYASLDACQHRCGLLNAGLTARAFAICDPRSRCLPTPGQSDHQGREEMLSIITILAVLAVVIGMVLWGTKYDRRGLILLLVGIAVLVGIYFGTGR